MAAWARDVENGMNHDGPVLALDAAVFDTGGRDRVTVVLQGPREDPDGLGRRAAHALRDQGAIPLLERARSNEGSSG